MKNNKRIVALLVVAVLQLFLPLMAIVSEETGNKAATEKGELIRFEIEHFVYYGDYAKFFIYEENYPSYYESKKLYYAVPVKMENSLSKICYTTQKPESDIYITVPDINNYDIFPCITEFETKDYEIIIDVYNNEYICGSMDFYNIKDKMSVMATTDYEHFEFFETGYIEAYIYKGNAVVVEAAYINGKNVNDFLKDVSIRLQDEIVTNKYGIILGFKDEVTTHG